MNGDAAEEVVRMVVNTADITIRLVGAGAKNLALLFVAWAKQEKVHVGKTSLPKLLSSGDELHVLSLTKEQYAAFKKHARKKITYAPFLNTKNNDGTVDIVLGARQYPLVNRILSQLGLGRIEPGSGARAEILNERDKEALDDMSFEHAPGDSKKNDTPSRSGSKECRGSSQGREDPRNQANRKPSVEKRLEENKRKLEKQRKKERPREKSRQKTKTKSTGKDR